MFSGMEVVVVTPPGLVAWIPIEWYNCVRMEEGGDVKGVAEDRPNFSTYQTH